MANCVYRKNVIEALLTATSLVVRWARDEISLQEFVSRYGNFFHYEALDGHEASSEQKQVLDELHGFIELHEKIQNTFVDAVYFGDAGNKRKLEESGRITIDEAERRLKDLCSEYHIEDLIRRFSD